jgi:hypothetical protein
MVWCLIKHRYSFTSWNEGSLVSIVMGYGLDDWGIGGLFPGRGKRLFSLRNIQTGSEAYTAYYAVSTVSFLPSANQMGHELDRWHPCSEVKNARTYNFTPPFIFKVRCLVKHTDKFTFAIPCVFTFIYLHLTHLTKLTPRNRVLEKLVVTHVPKKICIFSETQVFITHSLEPSTRP